jgi:bifunctional N-acetylglutamate synthase/kinase
VKITDLPHKQAARYLKELQAFEPHRQLLIKVGGGLLKEETAVQDLAEALAELARNGVHTLLVHGGGIQLNAALKLEKVTPRFIDGKRYTDEATLKLARTTFEKIGGDLVRKFGDAGMKAVALPSEKLFKARHDPDLGLVGTEITSIDTGSIVAAAKKYPVVVIRPLTGDMKTGRTMNVNADTVFRALATELKPHRMASLTPTGGVLKPIKGSDSQELISGINIRDIGSLIEDGIVSGGMALKLRELASVLDKLDIGSAISITKPSDLLLELLTDMGSGTFVCKGQKIIRADDIDGLFTDLAALTVEVFGKSLPDDYKDQKFERVYMTGDHLAFGVVTRLSDGTPYLDKLAVSPQLQGRGIGESLWYCVARDYPRIVWRSHVNNRYATWYHRHADIMKRSGEWILFGKGVDFTALEALEDELVAVPQMR